MVIAVVGGVITVMLLAWLAMGGDGEGDNGGQPQQPAAPSNQAPTPPPTPTDNTARDLLAGGTAKEGKPPTRPAPAITEAMVNEWSRLYQESKNHYNNYQREHAAGNREAKLREAALAKDKLDAAKAALDEPMLWWDEAILEDWAMPAEYAALEPIHKKWSTLNKKIRMTGTDG